MIDIDKLKGKKVGVVLSSGFFGFFAHAGFLAALEERGIKPCGISGTSAGALVAGYSCAGVSTEKIRELLFSLDKSHFWDPDYCHLLLSSLIAMRGWTGFLRGSRFKSLLKSTLPISKVEDCIIPCSIVASDVVHNKKAIMDDSSLVDAIYASGAVPGLFKPLTYNNTLLVDGGLVDKAPVLELYNKCNPDIILVHYLPSKSLDDHSKSFLKKSFTIRQIVARTSNVCRGLEYRRQCEIVGLKGCQVIEIKPDVPRVSPSKLHTGEVAYMKAKDDFLQLTNKH